MSLSLSMGAAERASLSSRIYKSNSTCLVLSTVCYRAILQ
uniref:Uncharacterized protein n=1 Tax=Arundo donax TaxID=35708 RepID=A0A0A8ZED9_ARUDO